MPIEVTNMSNSRLSVVPEGSAERTGHDEKPTTDSESKSPSRIDTLSITKTATQLQSIEREISEIPVIDMERVETMQQLLSSGEYEIDTTQLADKLLSFEMKL